MTTSAVAVLESQHRDIEALFEHVSDPDADHAVVLHTLLKNMAAHITAERSTVVHVVKKHHAGGDTLAEDLLDDYKRMEKLMVLIERRKVNSPDMPDLVTDLMAASADHVARSRTYLAPALVESLSQQELSEMGEKIAAADEVVVSHPHPHLLSLGPISDLTTRVAAHFDHLRDRTVDNRQTPPTAHPSS